MSQDRTRSIIRVLSICLLASSIGAVVKIFYGAQTHMLAFVADGIHSLFDSSATIIGIVSVIQASRPPDADHPYGHHKFETIASLLLAFMLILAGWEVGSSAWHRLLNPSAAPVFSYIGLLIIGIIMIINLSVAYFESKNAKSLKSDFLLADSFHNQADFLVSLAVLVSLLATKFSIPIVDPLVALFIAIYLVYLAVRVIIKTARPLVDHRVLDANEVTQAAVSTQGVLHCHAVRSRGKDGTHFLDLRIHLAGNMTLEEAHQVTHTVEDKLKQKFSELTDVVIHTEPHDHVGSDKEE